MRDNWQQALDRAVDERYPQLVAVRRWLHAHPEPSGQEQQTSRYLGQLLAADGCAVEAGPQGRGLICEQGSPEVARPIALRADIDALRIHDAKQVEYRSQCPGIMHACGHDAHAAIVYGAVSVLGTLCREGRLPWPVRVRAVFQPAEETCEGAQQMIAAGATRDLAAILAVHVDPTLPVRHIGLRSGVLTANCDEMRVLIHGRGGHAARPHETSDPIAAAAQLINSLYLYIPRVTDSQEAVVVTIGQVHGGDNANVIPGQVALEGTIRTLDGTVRRHTLDHIRRIAHGIGETTDTRIQVEFGLGTHSVCNDPQLIELLRWAAAGVVGAANVKTLARPSMGSEDFAFYLDEVPGAMMRVGCASPTAGASALHTPQFDVDEEVLRLGAKILSRAAVRWFDPAFQRELSPDEDRAEPSPRGEPAP